MCLKSWPVLALVAATLLPRAAFASQEAAKRYFQNGVELITASEPNYQDAYYQFQLAYQESGNSWKVLGNLGLCALKLERDQEALTYYEQYLLRGGSEIATDERQAIEQDLLLLKGNLATVHITSPVRELKIVDRRAGSPAPAQSYTLKNGVLDLQMRAGSHSISAIHGDDHLTWEVVLEPKAKSAHVFDFDAPAKSAPAAAGSLPAPSAAHHDTGASSSGLRIPAFVSLGVGAVGLGLGGYFAWQSSDAASQSNNAFACNTQPGGCTDDQRAAVRGFEHDSNAAKTRAIVAFSAGGAVAITGVVLLVLSGHSPNEKAQATLQPWLGYSAVGMTGSF